MPPVECVEIALWDRFKWGPEQTKQLTSRRLRIIFALLEQEKVTKDAVENLGSPDQERIQQQMAAGKRYVPPELEQIPIERRMKIVTKKLGE